MQTRRSGVQMQRRAPGAGRTTATMKIFALLCAGLSDAGAGPGLHMHSLPEIRLPRMLPASFAQPPPPLLQAAYVFGSDAASARRPWFRLHPCIRPVRRAWRHAWHRAPLSIAAQQSSPDVADSRAAEEKMGGGTHPAVLLKGTALNHRFQRDMGPYDVLPVPQDLPEQGSPSRPVFKQRNGSSVIYFIEDSWVVGTTAGSFEGVSFFAQDTALSPCDVATEWYELGPEGAISNPSLLVQPLSSSAAAQLLQLAAEQATSIGAIRHMMVPHAQQLDTVPADEDVAALTDDMRVLRSLLGADAASDFDDEAWRRVAEAHRRVLLELFLALGAAQRSFAVDQRLPIAHGRALLLLTSLVEDAKGCPGREGLYTVLKFISKKEQLPPVARLISETQGVPVFAQQRLLTRQCQAIERALSSTIAVISTLLILRHRDAQTATAATTTLVRDSAPGAVPSQKAIQRAINKALEAAGGGVGGGGGGAAFLAAIRPAAEHMHVYDKHPALLLASRAFYTPGWATAPSRAVAGCVYEAVADDAYDAVHKLLPKSKANQQAAKTLVPFLEIPARHCMAVEEGGGGAQAGRGKSTGIGELLDRILALPGGQGPDLLRALLLWALELSRESMVRPGALPAMHPAITSSQTAVDLLANHKVCVEGKKKDRELLSGDLCLVGRLSLLLARASVAAGPEPGGGEDQGGERGLAEARKEKEGAELAGLVNGVLIATWLRHSPGLRPSWAKHTRSLAGGNIKQLVRATFVQLAAEVAPEVLAAHDGVGSPAVSEASRGRAAAGGGAAAMGAAAVKRAKRKSKKRRRQAWSTRAGGGAGERAAVCETDSDGRGVGAAGVDGGGVGMCVECSVLAV